MGKLDENMEWELETPVLAGLSRQNPYRVPANYFEKLSTQVGQQFFISELNLQENIVFKVPENYFEGLVERIDGKIAIESLKSMTQDTGFAVPSNYFDGLTDRILNQATKKEQPKIIRLWQNSFFKYAAAACLLLLMGSGLFYNNYRSKILAANATELANENMLYDIEESVIREHILESQSATNSTASEAEIEKYILNNLSSSDITNNM